GKAKQSIIAFVAQVTQEDSPDFVPPAERVAVFDNDGTLWSEQPMYFQVLFALDRVKAVAADHPEWKETEPFRAVLEDDREALAGMGMHEIVEIVMATHSGLTTDEFAQVVEEWMATARHPRFGVPYTDLVYQPMLELLSYLRESGFKTFIVSGGGIDFMRVFTERVYGIPPEQVVGSSGNLEFAMVDGVPTLTKTAGLDFIDDKAGKPVGIWRFIGRRPILAGGNSDGDLQMLQYTAPGDRTAFGLIVHHDDDEREVAYDRDSHVGRLDVALTEAPERGWVVVSMKNDWSKVFPSPELP
ncbi:MAG: haloacid dehalogenase-like hydrolase, partial [Gemmatimonadetes bacterium]|nr:haloacid dehalogenase-like hydrolase [Gemmatimonadota bacterium]